jgi:antitoxin ParD1/3/4
METMNISLPEPLKDFVEQQVVQGGYGTASEYVRALIRDDQKRKAEERLEALLLQGLDSGDAKEMTKKEWAAMRRTVHQRLTHRKQSA